MKIFKIILMLAAVSIFSTKADAQVVNGDFANGTASWSWYKSYSTSFDPCPPLQPFTPIQNTDTPFPNINQNYARSAKVTGAFSTNALNAVFCRKIEQEVFIPFGSKVLLDFWSNEGRPAGSINKYSNANIQVTLRDTSSSLVRSYPVTSVDGRYCDSLTGNACSEYFSSVIGIDSAFWGKLVKLSVSTMTGQSNSDFTVPATAYVDNIRLQSPLITNSLPKTGAWYNPSRSGHGFHISKTSDGRYISMWYTYLSNGKPIWYISDAASVINGVLNTKIYKSTWNYSTQTNTRVAVGDIRFEMHSNSFSTFSWDLYSINGDSPTGFDGGEPMSYLIGGDAYTGLWYEPALSGYGYSVDQRASGAYSAVTAFYYENGEPVWARGEKTAAPTGSTSFPMTVFKGVGLCPECNGQAITVTPLAVGEVGLSLDTNKSWVLLQNAAAATVWQRGTPQQPVDTARLTFP